MYKIRSNNSALWFRVITLNNCVPEEVRNLGKKREEPQFQQPFLREVIAENN
jgi:hypothetical protein